MDIICSSRFAWLLRNGNAMSRFYMVQFSIASTTQSTAHSALGPAARLATVVLDAGVPPKKPPSSPSVCPATAHRPQLVQNRPTSRHARAVKLLFWEPQP